jgi:hypothetical protein
MLLEAAACAGATDAEPRNRYPKATPSNKQNAARI